MRIQRIQLRGHLSFINLRLLNINDSCALKLQAVKKLQHAAAITRSVPATVISGLYQKQLHDGPRVVSDYHI